MVQCLELLHWQTAPRVSHISASLAMAFYDCTLCSYGTRSLQALTEHVCKRHRSDPNFHVNCKSCLRSYFNWESYRKHVQRGCRTMPGSEVSHASSMDEIACDNEDTMEVSDFESSQSTSSYPALLSRDWHEAAFILKIKEQYVLSQVAVDEVLSSTKVLMSEILSDVLDSVRGRVPNDTMQFAARGESDWHKPISLFWPFNSIFAEKVFQAMF